LTRVPRELRPRAVHAPRVLPRPVRRQADAARAERVRLDQLRSGADVVTVDRLDERGLLEVQEVEGAVERDSALVEEGAHGAVRQNDALLETVEEGMFQIRWLHRGRGSSIAPDIVLYCAARRGRNEGARDFMNILVFVKQVLDTETRIQLKDGVVDTTNVKWVANPYDEFAIEEALRIRERLGQGKITVVSLGP